MKIAKPIICPKKPTALLRTAALLLSVPVFYFALYCLVVNGVTIYWSGGGPKSRSAILDNAEVRSGMYRYIALNANNEPMNKKVCFCFLPAIQIHAKMHKAELIDKKYLPKMDNYTPAW